MTTHAHTMSTTSISTRRTVMIALIIGVVAAVGLALPAGANARGAAAPPRSVPTWTPHIERTILPTRSRPYGMQLATWYGPGLFGNGLACGRTLTRETWGIAHRTLPCGTLVTLAHHGRRVTVPVVDRGPFSGASIDLTSRTKEYLHFTSGYVRMTEVRKFRVLPRPVVRHVGTFASAH